VRDIEKGMRHWVEVCGIGPWYIAEKLPLHGFWYKEQRYDDIHLTIALANSGDVQLELIQQRDDAPSMYRDFSRREMKGCSTGRAGPRITMSCSTRPSPAAGLSANEARARAARSSISSTRATPARSSRWPS
jgi:hypothetical protein